MFENSVKNYTKATKNRTILQMVLKIANCQFIIKTNQIGKINRI